MWCVYTYAHSITVELNVNPPLGIELSERSGVPFYRQVQDQIGEAVRAGRLAPGLRLPSVRELSAGLMVSAITVRRAYAELERAGLIVRRQGRGTFVIDEVASAAEPAAHVTARAGLEGAVDRARALGLPPSDIRAVVDRHLARSQEEA